jgi:hypothetical protein
MIGKFALALTAVDLAGAASTNPFKTAMNALGHTCQVQAGDEVTIDMDKLDCRAKCISVTYGACARVEVEFETTESVDARFAASVAVDFDDALIVSSSVWTNTLFSFPCYCLGNVSAAAVAAAQQLVAAVSDAPQEFSTTELRQLKRLMILLNPNLNKVAIARLAGLLKTKE